MLSVRLNTGSTYSALMVKPPFPAFSRQLSRSLISRHNIVQRLLHPFSACWNAGWSIQAHTSLCLPSHHLCIHGSSLIISTQRLKVQLRGQQISHTMEEQPIDHIAQMSFLPAHHKDWQKSGRIRVDIPLIP